MAYTTPRTYQTGVNINKIAPKNVGIEGLEDILLGQVAIAFSDEDPTSPAKVIKTFKKDNRVSWTGLGSWEQPLYKSLEREVLLASGKASKSMTAAAELYWVARMELREKILEEYDFKLPHKKADNMARVRLEQSIKNRLGVIPFSMFSETGQIKRSQLFDSVDKQGAYILRQAANDAEKRLDIFYKQVKNMNSDNRYTYY